MSALEYVLATALLVAPPGTPELPPDANRWPAVQAALHQVAMEWEILDKRETRYVLARLEDYENDLNLLRRRHQELKDAPRVGDSNRFPDRSAVNDLLTFNRAYRRHLDSRQTIETDRSSMLQLAMRETDRLYQIWDSVRDARCEFYYVTVRRQALKRLQELLGPEAYYSGNLPPHVPLWHFQELR
ncbi:hypothetical protein [Tuwongella immobilis]|uniref:Hypothetical conserved protein n=1 Tax=Tuwongella immobilis TaxID=692036 RepID=A0A6C2YKP2_9BACT|nr:hypothetical protein [Tuwongella immobilis]VIP01944.1 Hypothetical conserved protein OS=uncultured planctomycete GN=HGMM_F22C11C15 PE=4 SV=1 [Tuwongella immobilis]VTR99920.1 Hypothetical conserved protein OS=uncultured planctomycete GN=HGMM_F22C11C15 PE=4 SV=1 [Tuwongella immobilis]